MLVSACDVLIKASRGSSADGCRLFAAQQHIGAMLASVALRDGKGVRRIVRYAADRRHIEHRRQSGAGGATGRKGQYPRKCFPCRCSSFPRALGPAQRFSPRREKAGVGYSSLRDRGLSERYNPTLAGPSEVVCSTTQAFKAIRRSGKAVVFIGRKCPNIYLDAFLDLMLPFLVSDDDLPGYAGVHRFRSATEGIGIALVYAAADCASSRFDAVRAHGWMCNI